MPFITILFLVTLFRIDLSFRDCPNFGFPSHFSLKIFANLGISNAIVSKKENPSQRLTKEPMHPNMSSADIVGVSFTVVVFISGDIKTFASV